MPSEEKKRSRGLMWVVWLMALVPPLYLLSMGPVLLLWRRMGWHAEPFMTAYAPAYWLHDHTPLQGLIGWYMRLWVGG
jgi:hypothetical protein